MRCWLPPRQARGISPRGPCPRHATTPPRSSPPPGPPDHCPPRWAAIGAPAVWPDVFPSGRHLTDRTARYLGARCGAGPRAHLAFGAREPPAGMPRRNSGAACRALSGPRPARIRHTWLVSRRWLPQEQDTTFSSVTNPGADLSGRGTHRKADRDGSGEIAASVPQQQRSRATRIAATAPSAGLTGRRPESRRGYFVFELGRSRAYCPPS
jgi:hypothetical protein